MFASNIPFHQSQNPHRSSSFIKHRTRRFLPRTLDLDRSFYLFLAGGFLLWKGTIFASLLSSIGFSEHDAVIIAFGAIVIEVALYHGAFSARFPRSLKLIYLGVAFMFASMSVVTVGYALYKKSAAQVQYTERSMENKNAMHAVADSLNVEGSRLKKIISACESRNYFTKCQLTGRDAHGTRRYLSVGELEKQRRALQQKWIKKEDEIAKFQPDVVTDDFFVKLGGGDPSRGMGIYAFARAVILETAALLFLFTFYFLSGKSLVRNARTMCEEHVFGGLGQRTRMEHARHVQGTDTAHCAEVPPAMLPVDAPQRPTELAVAMADELTSRRVAVREKNAAIQELAIAGEVPLSAIVLGKLFQTRPETVRNRLFPELARQGWIVAYDQGGKTYYRKAMPEDGAEPARFGHYGWVLNIPEKKRKESFPFGFFDHGFRNGEYQRAKSRQQGAYNDEDDRLKRVNGSEGAGEIDE